VSNAFRVSAGERTRQFGILKSVGATKQQIASSVLYEGVFLCVIGIPVGIAAGLLIALIGTGIITNLLHSMSSGGVLNVDSEDFLTVSFSAPPLMFVVAIVTSFGTVLLSAWLPARKAATIPSIDAIRNSGDIKIKSKNDRTSKLTQKIFGFEGALAVKSLKRSRRNFRATVLSLTISIVLIVAAGSFQAQMKRSTALMFQNIDATVETYWMSGYSMSYGDNGEIEIDYLSISHETTAETTDKFKSFDGAEIFSLGGIGIYSAKLPDGTEASGAIISVDAERYEAMCKTAGVPVGSSLLVNVRRDTEDGRSREFTPYDFTKIINQELIFSISGHEPVTLAVSGELTGQDVPYDITNSFNAELIIIVPECESMHYYWYADVADTTGFTAHAEQILGNLAPQAHDYLTVDTGSLSIADIMKQLRDLVNTIMFFVYGFVGMLTLIAVTNVISTINTNVRSRAREFAALESVGMTKSGIKKMLNLESLLCSSKSLIFGLPLGFAGAYLLHWGMGVSVGIAFSFPWLPVIGCVLGVFAITWVTMRYSAARLRGDNIIETIRSDSGM
jgi:putative ABC transport system permease protein